jgi:3-oxoacyl-ACP reductase-like protein
MSISFAPELGDAVREAAERAGMTLSAWLAEAARAKLRAEEDEQEAHKRRMQGLNEFLDEWEAEHGAFTEEELAAAAREMGLPWPPQGESA